MASGRRHTHLICAAVSREIAATSVNAVASVPTPVLRFLPYGSGFNTDTRANKQIGGADRQMISYFFRAEQSSTIASVRWAIIGTSAGSGYGLGDGGTIRVTIQSDSGGLPSGTVLATNDVDYDGPDTLSVFPVSTFSTPATTVAGTVYHVVYENVHALQSTNYISINSAYVYGSVLSPRQPRWADSEFGMMLKPYYSTWSVLGGYTPVLDVTYGNGQHQGAGYIGVTLTPATISGSLSMVRERFTVSGGNKTVAGAAVRVARNSGSGSLTVTLEDDTGSAIDSFSVSAASVPVLNGTLDASSGVWLSGTFSTPRTLTNGQTYRLRLSTDASTSLWTRGMETGAAVGFNSVTYFADGYGGVGGLQRTTDGSTWTAVAGLGTRGEMQFYFTVIG